MLDRQPTLKGETLLLRPLRPDDWEELYNAASDREVWALHPAHNRWQEPVFRAFFDDALDKGGALAVVDSSTGKLIGSSRYQDYDAADGGAVEIGWTFLARTRWGSGANTEMTRLMLRHALQQVARVRFRVGEDNVVSRRAMEKIGASLTDRVQQATGPDGPYRNVIYEIDREGFAAGPLA